MGESRTEVRRYSVAELDGLAAVQAEAELRTCCAADAWVHSMLAARPFGTLEALLDNSDALVGSLDDAALEQAMAAHARIGERRAGAGREDAWSCTEQAGALAADDDLSTRIAEGNRAYEERFGHVFLIRAAGRSAQEMYDALQERLSHDPAAERNVVLHELSEIVRLRLARLVTG